MKRYSIYLRVVLTITLLLLPLGVSRKLVHADGLSKVKDVIDDSRPSNDTSHEIYFVATNGVAISETIIFEFDVSGTAFDLTGIDFADIDLAEDNDNVCDGTWTEKTLAGTATASDWGVAVNTTTDIITFTAPSSGTPITANRCVQIEIGDNATGGTGNDEINNPSSANYYDILISGTIGNNDTGRAKIVVIDTLTARVTVSETLSFTVGAVDLATCDDRPGDNVHEVATTGGTLVDFGSVNTEEFYDACHLLTIGTNAANGYSVTVKESDQLTYGGSTIADGVCDSTCTESSEGTWATSANNGFGYCLDDLTGDGGATADASMAQCDDVTAPEYKIFAEHDVDTPDEQTIMLSAGSLTANDTTHLGYRISIPGSQAAGTYQNNMILVATPTY